MWTTHIPTKAAERKTEKVYGKSISTNNEGDCCSKAMHTTSTCFHGLADLNNRLRDAKKTVHPIRRSFPAQ